MRAQRSTALVAVGAALALATIAAGCGSSSAAKTTTTSALPCANPITATHAAGATSYTASYDSPAGPNLYQLTFTLGHDATSAGTSVAPSRTVSFLVFDRGPVPNGFGSTGCSGALTVRVFYPLPAGVSAPRGAFVVTGAGGTKLIGLDYEFRNLTQTKILPAQAQRHLTLTRAPQPFHVTAAGAKELAKILRGYPAEIAVDTGVRNGAYPLDGSSVCDLKWPGGQSMKLPVGWDGPTANALDVSTPQCQYLAHQVGAKGVSNQTYPPQPAATQTR